MALQFISNSGKVAIGQDDATGERGILMKLLNKTGATTVKGMVIAADPDVDMAFEKQSSEYDAFGIVQEAGVADGSEAWIWLNGSIAEVLWKDGETATRAYVALCADTDGRAYNIAVPSGSPGIGDHWKEIGHVMESKSSGTDVLVRVHLHFN